MHVYRFILLLAMQGLGLVAAAASFPEFKVHEINSEAGTGLAIAAEDVNGDGRVDIVGVSDSTVAWYENPTWTRHLMTERIKGSNVCIAGRDLDGDGVLEFALGADWQFNNTASGGALYLLRHQESVSAPWSVTELLAEQPTLHRIRWVEVAPGRPALVVAPLKGINARGPAFTDRAVKLFLLYPGSDGGKPPWGEEVIDDTGLHVLHNISTIRLPEHSGESVLTASREGIRLYTREESGRWQGMQFAPGHPEPTPGAGEIKAVGLGKEGRLATNVSEMAWIVLATIEPWHGDKVVVWGTAGEGRQARRHVIDDTFAEGHAVQWADFDGDGRPELLAGHRGKSPVTGRAGLKVYALHWQEDGGLAVTAHMVDDGGMATEDAVVADFTGDGRLDIAAFGRATQNIRMYENLGAR
jgi:hypothetical protein